ncbi:GTP-binding protein [Cnuibacter physcomitrellae]|uniref:GTP-binding protein n=1 Tax=Cnuibacter physcomitrellae TaxID=1619308 RepID=UPI0021757E9C|nr:GTP-binding protein [Cnuibacter physcomitrellae]MCS5497255.1 GTP-binding protein [Cnuibacter physcomitrellae]
MADQLRVSAAARVPAATTIALDPSVDVMEFALMLEHLVRDDRAGLPIVLDRVATVTSIAEIRRHLLSSAPLAEDDWDRSERVAGRLEFADVIVATDLGGGAGAEAEVRALLARLNPGVRLSASVPARVGLPMPGLAHHLASSMGWQRELSHPSLPQTEGVRSFVFKDPRPFHPERLHAALSAGFGRDGGRIARSRGLCRLATRMETVASWSSAGDVLRLDPTGMSSWDQDSPAGQELVFFGPDLDRDALSRALCGALLTTEEILAGPRIWAELGDPFPTWPDERSHSH